MVISMKNRMKKILFFFCTLLFVLGLAACGKKVETQSKLTVEEIEFQTQLLVNGILVQLPQEELENILDMEAEEVELGIRQQFLQYGYSLAVDGAGFQSAVESMMTAKKEMGGINEIQAYNVVIDKDGAKATSEIIGQTRNASIEVEYNARGKMTSITVTPRYAMGEVVTKAALNTVLGMGTTFSILILISLIISCFSFIPKIQAKYMKQPVILERKEEAAVIEHVSEKDELSHDLELCAVVTAAIAAYESANGGSGEGFVVRSIKKSNKWRKA